MSYLKTPSGLIYELVDNKYLIFDGKKIPIDLKLLEKSNIISEKPEDLCDEFVVVPISPAVKDMKPRIQKGMTFEQIAQAWINSKKKTLVYGAIWTPEGLTYKFKMNDEGNLELIKF